MKIDLKSNAGYLRIIFALMLVVPVSRTLHSQEKIKISAGIKETFYSSILNEDRTISVYLPNGYDISSKKYPVLYLLDGKTHFQHAIGAVNFLSINGIIPQTIIVAIHNVDRNRDFSPVPDKGFPNTGGAEKFLDFVSQELIQHVNINYRTSKFSVLMGHSFGGTFIAYTLLKQPETFDAYIAISPYLQYANNHIVNASKQALRTKFENEKFLYMTIGNEPNYFSALREYEYIIQEKTKNIRFKYVKMEAESHASIPYISLFNGLRFTFSDWQMPQELINQGLSEIDAHYKKVSKLYGIEAQTPENTINQLGYNYLGKNDFLNAITVFKENTKRYPNSANVYDSLGEAYERNKQLNLAKKNYEIAYKLGKEQDDINTSIFLKNLERVQSK